ncbi:unnamed protein product [Bursaphelenchus xylophilus]|uniref:(pine wood nematode) hypothetical protein n=1 Tax=Bursaphelenchus xylophilus TaxID=6326 RepID=A0A1I7SCI9_BURXY|nr:unnamed protein product [Bursaphelenchus xylophilus]CAG9094021.1 unnamed protein product [Bursaphelenchus xylophilus]
MILTETEIMLYVIEMLLNAFGFFVSFLFLYVLWQTKLFLRNHKFYLSNVVIANIVTIVFRYPQLIQLLSEKKLYSDETNARIVQVHDMADSVAVNMIVQLIIFGDVTAVVMGKDEMSLLWVILLCCLSWVLGELNIQLGAMNIPPPLYSQALMECVNIICWIAFFGLIYMGKVKYRQQTVGDIKHKYRISICLRTLAVLKVMAICSAIRNFICINVIISLFVWIRPNKDVDGERFVSFFYDLTLAFYAAIVPFLMIWSHDEMQKTYGRLCANKFESPITKVSVTTTNNEVKFIAKNVVGDVITANPQDEAKHHFQQLQNNWNTRRLSVQHVPQKSQRNITWSKGDSLH